MTRVYYAISKNAPPKGYVYALKCDNKFYVITKESYKRAKNRTGNLNPVFLTDIPIYIDGINI